MVRYDIVAGVVGICFVAVLIVLSLNLISEDSSKRVVLHEGILDSMSLRTEDWGMEFSDITHAFTLSFRDGWTYSSNHFDNIFIEFIGEEFGIWWINGTYRVSRERIRGENWIFFELLEKSDDLITNVQWYNRGRLVDENGPYVPYGYWWGSGPWDLWFNDSVISVDVKPIDETYNLKQYTLLTEDGVVILDAVLCLTRTIPINRTIYIWRVDPDGMYSRMVISFPEDHVNATGGWIFENALGGE